MRVFIALLFIFTFDLSHGRSFASIRKDAFTVGISRSDSASEYDFIAEITKKMKFPKFRLVAFDNAGDGEKLLLGDKIDAIISRINYSPHLESKFLLSEPYSKNEIALAVLLSNNHIWTLGDLNGKKFAFIPKEVSSEQILAIWPSAKLSAARNLGEALSLLRSGEAETVIASRETLETEKQSLKIFPNKLAENNIVALFAPNSKTLQEEFNKKLRIENGELRINPVNPVNSVNSQPADGQSLRLVSGSDNIARIMALLDELKKELEILKKELK